MKSVSDVTELTWRHIELTSLFEYLCICSLDRRLDPSGKCLANPKPWKKPLHSHRTLIYYQCPATIFWNIWERNRTTESLMYSSRSRSRRYLESVNILCLQNLKRRRVLHLSSFSVKTVFRSVGLRICTIYKEIFKRFTATDCWKSI